MHPVEMVVPACDDAEGVPVREGLLSHVLGHQRRLDLVDVLEAADCHVGDLQCRRRRVLVGVTVGDHLRLLRLVGPVQPVLAGVHDVVRVENAFEGKHDVVAAAEFLWHEVDLTLSARAVARTDGSAVG
jgi:hypothetical protein